MATLHETFPTPFQVNKVVDSVLGKELSFFFVSGVLRQKQYDHLVAVIDILAVHNVEDKLIVSTLISEEKCEELCKYFEPQLHGGRHAWGGQYYVLASEVVRACKEALKAPSTSE